MKMGHLRWAFWSALSIVACVACTPAASPWQQGAARASGIPGDIDCYEAVARAEIYAAGGYHPEAIEAFRTAVAADPRDPYLKVRLADELLANSQLDEAGQLIEDILDDHPCRSDAWLSMAELEHRNGHADAGIDCAAQALRCEPRNVQAMIWLARLHATRACHQVAFEFFGRALLVEPSNPEAHLGLAEAALELQRWPDAYSHLSAYVTIWPNHSAPLIAQADRFLASKQPEVAAEILSIALRNDHDNEPRQKQLIATLWQIGDLTRIEQHLAQLPPPEPDDREGAHFHACYLTAVGRAPHAKELLAPFLNDPDSESKALSRAIDQHVRRSRKTNDIKELPEPCRPYTTLK